MTMMMELSVNQIVYNTSKIILVLKSKAKGIEVKFGQFSTQVTINYKN